MVRSVARYHNGKGWRRRSDACGIGRANADEVHDTRRAVVKERRRTASLECPYSRTIAAGHFDNVPDPELPQ